MEQYVGLDVSLEGTSLCVVSTDVRNWTLLAPARCRLAHAGTAALSLAAGAFNSPERRFSRSR